jgi:hypothetical protein
MRRWPDGEDHELVADGAADGEQRQQAAAGGYRAAAFAFLDGSLEVGGRGQPEQDREVASTGKFHHCTGVIRV